MFLLYVRNCSLACTFNDLMTGAVWQFVFIEKQSHLKIFKMVILYFIWNRKQCTGVIVEIGNRKVYYTTLRYRKSKWGNNTVHKRLRQNDTQIIMFKRRNGNKNILFVIKVNSDIFYQLYLTNLSVFLFIDSLRVSPCLV